MKKLPIHSKTGFTLVEIVVVILIVAVLTALSYPIYNGYIDKAKVTLGINSLEWTRKVLEDYHLAHGAYPQAIDFNTGLDPSGDKALIDTLVADLKKSTSSIESYNLTVTGYSLIAKATDSKRTLLTLTPGQVVTQGP